MQLRSIRTLPRRCSAWREHCDRRIKLSPSSSWRVTTRSRKSGAFWTVRTRWPTTVLKQSPLTTGLKQYGSYKKQSLLAVTAAAKADLHRKLGIIDCQSGDLDKGEKELQAAKALNPERSCDPGCPCVDRPGSEPARRIREVALAIEMIPPTVRT